MRIAFVGKGGSGKTTIASLLSKLLISNNAPVLAIDADINQHLGESLGFRHDELTQLPKLGSELPFLKEYLRGTNDRITSAAQMIKTTMPGKGSHIIRFSGQNPLFEKFILQKDLMRFMAVGEFDKNDLGVKCYHSKTGSVELVLNHMIDGKNEYVIVDMSAGADAFASGLFTRFDLVMLVVEPTTKSISVYQQFLKYSKDFGVTIKVCANKIQDERDVQFIQEHCGDSMIASIGTSEYIRSCEKGDVIPFGALEHQNRGTLETIVNLVNEQTKNWKRYWEQGVQFHIRNAEVWGNAATGEDLTKQIDPDFSYQPP